MQSTLLQLWTALTPKYSTLFACIYNQGALQLSLKFSSQTTQQALLMLFIMCDHLPFTLSVNGIHGMPCGISATMATTASTRHSILGSDCMTLILMLWLLSDLEIWRLTALEHFVPHRQTHISIPWAPVGAKNLINHHFQVRYYDRLEGWLMLILTPPSKIRPSFWEKMF